MKRKLIFKYFAIFCLFFNSITKASDITSMSNISEAAGSSAQAAADQLASDADKVVANIPNNALPTIHNITRPYQKYPHNSFL